MFSESLKKFMQPESAHRAIRILYISYVAACPGCNFVDALKHAPYYLLSLLEHVVRVDLGRVWKIQLLQLVVHCELVN